MDFSHYLEKFSSINPPSNENLKKCEIKDEELNFFFNLKLFKDVTIYLKGCFEVYSLLIKQLQDMLLPYKKFIKIMQYLARCRMNISNLILTAKNVALNFNEDLKNVNKYLGKIIKLNNIENRKEIENNFNINNNNNNNNVKPNKKIVSSIPKMQSKNFKINSDLTEKIRKQFKFVANEENQKIIRLKNILNK